ncbi:MAG: outer membrane lipoprotein carrier protein LolA [Pseudomonadales bacterium]|jgi:hypothetical protein|nr:outer membrane lipoprotein carrier protein LolA [Pseudomonadales bacterium]
MMQMPWRGAALLSLLLVSLEVHAFSLEELEAQLRATPIVRGQFVQQKFLRSLAEPLTTQGDFTLAADKGLLWFLREPIVQDLRMTYAGVARRDAEGQWQTLPQQAGGARESRIFLAVLAGDTRDLRESFDISLSGTETAWKVTMTPSSALLRQIFSGIVIEGGRFVDRIELHETQGDRTVLAMENPQAAQALNDEEVRAYGE